MKIKIYAKGGFKLIIKDLNRRKAIRERCMNCVAWTPKDVENCFADDCQLYLYRSGVGKQDPKSRSKAIREYCLWCCAGQPYEVQKCVSRYCPLFPYRQANTDKSVECA